MGEHGGPEDEQKGVTHQGQMLGCLGDESSHDGDAERQGDKAFCHLHKRGVGCSVEAEGEVHVLPSPCTDLLLPVELLFSQPFYLKSGNSACSSIALNKNQSVTLSIYHVKK